tara:strand:- start:550 stop:909 length:360 start_codon:yes stop_codon:yes gene_type:complete
LASLGAIRGITDNNKEKHMNNQDNTYNGWTNFETWQAALWLDNDGLIEILREEDNITLNGVVNMLDLMTYEQAELGVLDTRLLGDIMTHGEFKGDTGLILDQWWSLVNIQEIVDNNNED